MTQKCYHVYLWQEGANSLLRVRKCYRTQQAANKAALPDYSKMAGPDMDDRIVKQCPKQCECWKQKKNPCPNKGS